MCRLASLTLIDEGCEAKEQTVIRRRELSTFSLGFPPLFRFPFEAFLFLYLTSRKTSTLQKFCAYKSGNVFAQLLTER